MPTFYESAEQLPTPVERERFICHSCGEFLRHAGPFLMEHGSLTNTHCLRCMADGPSRFADGESLGPFARLYAREYQRAWRCRDAE